MRRRIIHKNLPFSQKVLILNKMGYKIFVSYKYHDDSVYPLPYKNYLGFSTVRNYVDKLESYFDQTSNIYKGESDNEDLSHLSEACIWEKLKDRIYDSSVTIVMVSPNMREQYRSERSQWIPWEIAYSLRETTRADRTSHSNAILAVILPDRNYQYEYFTQPFSYQQSGGQWCSGTDTVFSIIRKNMNNKLGNNESFFSSHGIFPISTNDGSYIPSVTWKDFISHPMRYIECAIKHKERISEYRICKEIAEWSVLYG